MLLETMQKVFDQHIQLLHSECIKDKFFSIQAVLIKRFFLSFENAKNDN